MLSLFGLVRKKCRSPGDWLSLADCWKVHHDSYLPWPRKPCFCKSALVLCCGFSVSFNCCSNISSSSLYLLQPFPLCIISRQHRILSLPQLAPVGSQYKQTIAGNVCALTGIPYTEVHSWGCTALTSRLMKSACFWLRFDGVDISVCCRRWGNGRLMISADLWGMQA